MMALLDNVVLGLLLRRGVTHVPDARRDYADDPHQALDLEASLTKTQQPFKVVAEFWQVVETVI